MLTVLVLVGQPQARDLIARIESVPDVCVLSHTHDSDLALARARVLLPDVLVLDLSGCFAGDAASVVHRARLLDLPSELVVHAGGSEPGALTHTLTRLARNQLAS
ncbi:hypothetical protein ABZ953_19975 [Streptomyces sp. NPDC046465]|uniref:hypothetical protein n=1 Tax=Streptomyces sp. NPDC046465 TaxID=3155810 RepID=UPI0033F85122